MLKTIKLNEKSFLIIEYFPRPKADEKEIYNSAPDRMWECDNVIDNIKLLSNEGMTEFNPKEFHRMAKEFIDLKEAKPALPTEKLVI